jgi:hypothetical protein
MKTALYIALVFLALQSNSQNSIGLGKLKIGMDVSEIKELSNAKKIKPFSSDYIKYVYKNYSCKYFFEIKIDSTNESHWSIGFIDKSVRVFNVGSFNLTETIIIKNVTLRFKDNKLYHIECEENENLEEGLKVKFGPPKIVVKEKPKEYINELGVTTVKVEKEYTSIYNTGLDNIVCEKYFSIKYDYKGEEKLTTYTELFDKKIQENVLNNQIYGEIRILDKKESQSKVKYKDL